MWSYVQNAASQALQAATTAATALAKEHLAWQNAVAKGQPILGHGRNIVSPVDFVDTYLCAKLSKRVYSEDEWIQTGMSLGVVNDLFHVEFYS